MTSREESFILRLKNFCIPLLILLSIIVLLFLFCYCLAKAESNFYYVSSSPTYDLFIASSLFPITPVKEYVNSDLQKQSIISENNDKSGIYCWVNRINGKFYIGSSINLKSRLLDYFSKNHLEKKSGMPICKGLLKYGHASFSLYILEYCDKESTIQREQYYLDLLSPNYNILKTAGSLLGRKHSSETKLKISEAMKKLPAGTYHTMYGRILSDEIRKNMSLAKLGEKHFGYGKALTKEHKARISASQSNSQKVSVLDLETKTETIYLTMRAAAKALNVLVGSVAYSIKNNKPLKGRYVINKM